MIDMEKKNYPKRAFRKITVEMTGEAEVLVLNTRFVMRTFEAAMACSELYHTLTEKEQVKDAATISSFFCELLTELGAEAGLDMFQQIVKTD